MNILADPKNPKLMIVGGHMTPAFAVVDQLNKEGYYNIVWVGHAHSSIGDKNFSAEYKVATSRNIRFIDLKTGKLFRVWNYNTFSAAFKSLIDIPMGIFRAFKIIRTERPQMVIAFGGYLAVPIALAAYFYKIPITTHEQTIVTGLANRIVAKFASKVFTSWKENEKYFDKNKIVFTGNPIRLSVFVSHSSNINFYNNLPVLYVTGGNQGSHMINEIITKLLPNLLNEFNVIHQTGNSSVTHDYERSVAFKANLSDMQSERYIVKDFFTELEIGEVLKKSSIVISRSGLNSCVEFMALNKSCILIPIANTSGNEQEKNANHLEKIGLAKMLPEKSITPEILNKAIYDLLEQRRKGLNTKGELWNQTLVQTRMYIKKDAAERIVGETLKLLNITDVN